MTQHSALIGHTPKHTPQSEPIPGSDQVPNSAGGYAWEIDVWSRVQRFLILGVEGGTYYVGQDKLLTENVTAIDSAVKADGRKLVSMIVAVSDSGRAPSNDPALFALAYAAKKGDVVTRQHAHDALSQVARTGTHLFHFASYVKALGGFGRGTRRAIADWYRRDIDKVAYQAVKYRQRDGWTHRDLLRLSHAKPEDREQNRLFEWITQGKIEDRPEHPYLPEMVHAYEAAQLAETPAESARLIRVHNLPREAIKTDHLNSLEVWDALLEKMPYTAMIRNLATMTRIGLLTSMSARESIVVARLRDKALISKSRIHPIAVLSALKTYQEGRSVRGDNTWTPLRSVVDALNDTFYESFDNVESTGKRILLALDVSGSMGVGVSGGVPGLTARDATAAMSLVTARVESQYEIVGFTGGGRSYWGDHSGSDPLKDLSVLNISPRQRLDDVVRSISGLPFGTTDCALPMLYAEAADKEFDAFVVYTDNETWSGDIHPAQALQSYRQKSGVDARLVVVGTEAIDFSIADPNDPGMLDVVGFDTSAPNVISEFISGTL